MINMTENDEQVTAMETAFVAPADRPVLLCFCDDSTLFFALRMRDCLLANDPDLPVEMGWVVDESALSYRQMAQLLPEGPDRVILNKEFESLLLCGQVRAVLTSRVFRGLGEALRKPVVSLAEHRACVVSFLGGLDFFPKDGYFRRRNSDGVYLFPESDIAVYKKWSANWDVMWQDVGFGHPSFLLPKTLPQSELDTRKDVYFFSQAISPNTKRGRIHMLRALAAMARANPDRTVWVKLRHMPNENQKHLHREKHDYPGLMEKMGDLPDNLKVTACTMDEALKNAALAITCTSTAAIDALREGVPCMVHLDFVDNYMDDLVKPMERLFAKSGLITSLEDMLALKSRAPDPEWVKDMFCPRDLGARVMRTIRAFNTRPFQIPASQVNRLAQPMREVSSIPDGKESGL